MQGIGIPDIGTICGSRLFIECSNGGSGRWNGHDGSGAGAQKQTACGHCHAWAYGGSLAK
jgi:hypothetical protein